MKKFLLAAAFVTAAAMLTACGNEAKVSQEIKIPIYDSAESNVNTATVQRMDLSQTDAIGSVIGYPYADAINSENEGNLLTFELKRGDRLNEGDVIAVIDSSALNYEYTSQKILRDAAYDAYSLSGSNKDYLEYQEEQAKLDLIQYKIDCYTIKAPYDCVVTDTAQLSIGDVITAGTYFCTVAKPDEVRVYLDNNTDKFALGTKVSIKFTAGTYTGTVTMMPSASSGGRGKNFSLSRYVIITFDEGELERMLEDTPNAVSAGWATVYVTSVDKRDVLAVPEKAVKQFSGSIYCNLIDNGEKVQVPVEIGNTYNGYTIILSGLSEGDTVVAE